jgi:hypothetical protein
LRKKLEINKAFFLTAEPGSKVSLQHEKSGEIQKLILNVSRTLQKLSAITEGWEQEKRWACLLTYIFRHWPGGKWLGQLPEQAEERLLSD